MKTIIRLAIVWAFAGLTVQTVSAQKVLPKPSQPVQPKNGGVKNNTGNNNQAQGNNDKWWISIGASGGGPGYGPPPPNYGPAYGGPNYNYPSYGYSNYYGGGYYSYRKAARQSIRNTAYVIFNAIQQANWNGMYNPVLSNAVQHQQFAKYLYNCGDYMGALNHSRRAGYLAWQSLNFNYGMIPNPGYDGWDDMYGYGNGYNNGGYYDDGYYKQNGSVNTNGKQANPEPGATMPSNDELDRKIQQKNLSKDEMKGMKLSDLDIH